MIITKSCKKLLEAFKVSPSGKGKHIVPVKHVGETASDFFVQYNSSNLTYLISGLLFDNFMYVGGNLTIYQFNKAFVNRTTGNTSASGGNSGQPQLVLSYEENATENENDFNIDYDTILSAATSTASNPISISSQRYEGIVDGKHRIIWKGVLTNTTNSSITFNQIGSYRLFTGQDTYGASASGSTLQRWVMLWKHVFDTPITIPATESIQIAIVFDIDFGDPNDYADIQPEVI